MHSFYEAQFVQQFMNSSGDFQEEEKPTIDNPDTLSYASPYNGEKQFDESDLHAIASGDSKYAEHIARTCEKYKGVSAKDIQTQAKVLTSKSSLRALHAGMSQHFSSGLPAMLERVVRGEQVDMRNPETQVALMKEQSEQAYMAGIDEVDQKQLKGVISDLENMLLAAKRKLMNE